MKTKKDLVIKLAFK